MPPRLTVTDPRSRILYEAKLQRGARPAGLQHENTSARSNPKWTLAKPSGRRATSKPKLNKSMPAPEITRVRPRDGDPRPPDAHAAAIFFKKINHTVV